MNLDVLGDFGYRSTKGCQEMCIRDGGRDGTIHHLHMPAYIHTCRDSCIHTYRPTYLPTDPHTDKDRRVSVLLLVPLCRQACSPTPPPHTHTHTHRHTLLVVEWEHPMLLESCFVSRQHCAND